jgi:hypothetical protein
MILMNAIQYFRTAVFFLIIHGSTTLMGQHQDTSTSFLHDYRYGMMAGFTFSKFVADSTNYQTGSMPYGGLYLNMGFTENISVSFSTLYTIKGIVHNSPYLRYRYSYICAELTGRYQVLDFLKAEVGYRQCYATSSRVLKLNGGQSSGSIGEDIPALGDYGQFLIGGVFMISPKTDLSFRYGIENNKTLLTHYQVGICLHLNEEVNRTHRELSQKKSQKLIASREALELKEGVLLVRLLTMQSTIDALEQNGHQTEAQRIRQEVEKENSRTIAAFASYNFSPVYFFYDIHSGKIKDGNLDSVLLDRLLQPVSAPQFSGSVFVAEFGQYESTELYHQARRDFQYLKDNQIMPDSSAAWLTYADKGLGVGGLVIMNSYFIPVEKPFPSFIPLSNKTLFRNQESYNKAVLKFSGELSGLYFHKE